MNSITDKISEISSPTILIPKEHLESDTEFFIFTTVTIIGGGPVGLTLALELCRHGVHSIVVERNIGCTQFPKMDITNGRSMELFSRLGVANEIRNAGVPPNEPLDVCWVSFPLSKGEVIHRFRYLSPFGMTDCTRFKNDGQGTAEPYLRVSQIEVEPILKKKCQESNYVKVMFGWHCESSTETGSESIITDIRNISTKKTLKIKSKYVVGCDGGSSTIRRLLGITLQGEFGIVSMLTIHFHSTEYKILAKFGFVYRMQTRGSTLISQNGCDIWILHTVVASSDSAKVDPKEAIRKFLGLNYDIPCNILSTSLWKGHMALANFYDNSYKKKNGIPNFFLAGDCAHQLLPFGGYGMNTGIGDACDIGWKLAAVINKWGGEDLLRSYEVERRQIAQQNIEAARRHMDIRRSVNAIYKKYDNILYTSNGINYKMQMGEEIKSLGNAENESWGIEHGYVYRKSPIVIYNENEGFSFDPLSCSPSLTPGMRLPHVYFCDGSDLFHLLGPLFTLLVMGSIGEYSAASLLGILPLNQHESVDSNFICSIKHILKPVHLKEDPILKILGFPQYSLILVRPDQHVCWIRKCSQEQPVPLEEWTDVVKKVTGNLI